MRQKGASLMAAGKENEARECFRQAVQVTAEMKLQVLQACRQVDAVECLVAPYEADAQLAYLAHKGIVELVITEDSDLIPYGCQKIMLKLDRNGRGELFEASGLPRCLGQSAERFCAAKMRRMCIMAGCDYLQSLPNIALKKAFNFFSNTTDTDLRRILPMIPSYLGMRDLVVTQDYIDAFLQAELVFLHQIVFDPRSGEQVPLTPYPHIQNRPPACLGEAILEEEMARELALGNLVSGGGTGTSTLKRVANNQPPPLPDQEEKMHFSGWFGARWSHPPPEDPAKPKSAFIPPSQRPKYTATRMKGPSGPSGRMPGRSRGRPSNSWKSKSGGGGGGGAIMWCPSGPSGRMPGRSRGRPSNSWKSKSGGGGGGGAIMWCPSGPSGRMPGRSRGRPSNSWKSKSGGGGGGGAIMWCPSGPSGRMPGRPRGRPSSSWKSKSGGGGGGVDWTFANGVDFC